jgi:hypothetical protein
MESILEQLKSKKFRVAAAGAVGVVAIRLGMDPAVAADTIPWLVGIICTYLAAQGLADIGKSKTQLDLASLVGTAKKVAADMTDAVESGEVAVSAPEDEKVED